MRDVRPDHRKESIVPLAIEQQPWPSQDIGFDEALCALSAGLLDDGKLVYSDFVRELPSKA